MNPLAMLRQMGAIKQLLTDAEREARSMGDAEPGAEHLLLAAMDLPDGTATRVLATFGIDRERLRRAITEHHATALAQAGIEGSALATPQPIEPASGSGVYRSAASAREAFGSVATMARRDRALLGAHVTAAVAEMEHGTAAGVLRSLGVDREALATASRAEIAATR
jgi:ATP-dependent Clp protease ATP-binding subunit ClpA